ncbi:hypothetical protein TSOC_007248 [Tetrabaena socialis]|uniref:RING-type domain-containing protein n=1 Tax=Tetrabaena socialis TaxID=47790 RepID=A0A2J8A1J0_9CHLO|nr:hypothetical protein TSOC_007248 [Tetrabaena socialis]|eukprot:PNH06383.1 hypothetical protein TSOC_007248 [Tetrabaena socialis]
MIKTLPNRLYVVLPHGTWQGPEMRNQFRKCIHEAITGVSCIDIQKGSNVRAILKFDDGSIPSIMAALEKNRCRIPFPSATDADRVLILSALVEHKELLGDDRFQIQLRSNRKVSPGAYRVLFDHVSSAFGPIHQITDTSLGFFYIRFWHASSTVAAASQKSLSFSDGDHEITCIIQPGGSGYRAAPMSSMSSINSINSLNSGMSSINSDMSSINSDMSSINSDMSSINSDMSSINSDMSSGMSSGITAVSPIRVLPLGMKIVPIRPAADIPSVTQEQRLAMSSLLASATLQSARSHWASTRQMMQQRLAVGVVPRPSSSSTSSSTASSPQKIKLAFYTQSSEDDDDAHTCIVCLDRFVSTVLKPCNHAIMCGVCISNKKIMVDKNCIKCRMPVDEVLFF